MNARESCRGVFKELGILTLPSTYIFECLLYARKNLGNTPLNQDYHDYFTRFRSDVRPIKHRLAKLDKSFVCLSVRLYNKLPDSLKLTDDAVFRREVKAYLVDKSYYNIDEMLEI